jgi:hypothetical protein
MARSALMGSIVIFAFMVSDLVWGHTLLPRAVEFAAVICIVIAWLLVVSAIARREKAPLLVNVIGWLLVLAFVGHCVVRAFSGYYFLRGPWSRGAVLGVAELLFFASAMALAILLLPKPPSPKRATPYTVESDAPDHVLHVDSTPNYSLKRTAAAAN